MKYKKIRKHYFGFFDISISAVAKYFIEFFNQSSILITCLDSNPNITNLTKWMNIISDRKWNIKTFGNSVWIAHQHVAEIFKEENTFFGFDEIYLLKNLPNEYLKIKNFYTTDAYTFDKAVPNTFLETFYKLGAIRYLSDGCGLNFACESMKIVEGLKDVEVKMNNNLQNYE